jgi:hypothetical protein
VFLKIGSNLQLISTLESMEQISLLILTARISSLVGSKCCNRFDIGVSNGTCSVFPEGKVMLKDE